MAKKSQAADPVYKPFETLTKSLSRFTFLLLITDFFVSLQQNISSATDPPRK